MRVFIFLLFLIDYRLCQDPEPFQAIKLCDVCVCSEINDFDGTHLVFNILCSEWDRIKNVTDLDKIEWPQNTNGLKISATFEGLQLNTLGKLPPNSQVESLQFPNNAIEIYWPEPFSHVPNLKKLSLASNKIRSITFDLLKGIEQLEDLDLSDNKISEINQLCFKNLNNLKRVNLQNNQLTMMPIEAILQLPALEELDLGKNNIFDLMLQKTSGNGLTGLKRLSLKGNKIRSVMTHSFPDNNNLEFLDLSNNKIELVEDKSFLSFTNLKELNLGSNNITLVFDLPPSLEICILKINSMRHWPTFPSGIKYIDLSYNRLETLYDADTSFSYLEILYLGGNQIKEFDIANPLPQLFILDLSFNLLQEIPKTLSELNFPNLEDLRLDGNIIDKIYFPNVIVLKKLFLNDLPKLENVEEKAFTNVVGRGVDEKDDVSKCFYLYLSNCRSLSSIHENAFEGTDVCMLDVSYNNLTRLPRDLLQWGSVSEGVNLQHNPWHCGCELQWMLDQLLPLLYKANAYLLDNVRCGSPRAVEQLRLVHWYNWTDQTLCGDYLRAGPHMASSTTNPFLDMSTMTIILSAAILILSLIAMGLIIYLVVTRRKYTIRRKAMKRRKQNAADMNSNGHTEQIKALNKA
ncbi:SLIT and NTRK-like protein 6 [Ostrinia nubilalis]|uniref:SLIT and NTRK-like protein 6 n=1 Tax=Ostrinia nubilalis TaxID=29057 RepID=UPI00308267E1